MRKIVSRKNSKTFWRRRAIVLGTGVAVLGVTLYACSGSDPEPAGNAAPLVSASEVVATPEPAPAPSDTLLHPYIGDKPPAASAGASGSARAPGGPCADTDLKLEPLPASATIPKGGYLTIEFKVTNAATVSCVRDLGLAAQELQVKAGKERLWSSDDCSGEGSANRRMLQPGESTVSRVTWDGKTSTPGCRKSPHVVPAGKYQVLGRLGSAWSKPAGFEIT